MSKNTNGRSIALHIATPFIVGAIACGAIMIGSVKPLDKMKVYLNVAFMDDLKTDPSDASSGLIIRDNKIIEDYSGTTSDTGTFIRPRYGEMYAEIHSEKFSVDVPVYWGCDIELLERGACQSTGSMIAGDSGNTVISAHEDTFFSELSSLEKGDVIALRTNYGAFTYKVSEKIQFNKSDTKYVVPSKDDKLTLYTCKKNILGSADERIGVVCELTEKKFYNSAAEDNTK